MPVYMWFFLGSMAIGVPIVFCLGFAPLATFTLMGKPIFYKMIVQRMYGGVNQFPLMAIPFFILAGNVMNTSGITMSLVRLSNVLVGHLRGGLAQVNIFVSILFAGLSGSAVADTSAIGSILIPAMEKDGYSREFSAAVTAASSVIGPIIPPSIIMVIYAYVMGVSVGGLFAAGIIPGLIVGILLMTIAYIISTKRNYPKRGKMASLREIVLAFRKASLPLLTPVIIIGGILGGVFTPTEAAGIAAGYAIFLSLFVLRTISLKDIPKMLYETAITSSTILLIVGTATVFGWLVSTSQLPNKIADLLFSITANKYILFFIINLVLLVTGMFMDAGPAIMILGPVLAPTMIKMGIHPLHFAIVMSVNLTVGLATPPLGLILFVASGLTGLTIESIFKELIPFLLIEVIVIFLITYIPALSMTIPRLLGLLY
ncbi:MAG: TRAP transporter large permease [Deltaproteobacteria bacterium]|nr:TRAP transporter large permease [Deltaproteobacteria bacterium]MBW1961446.1 TRAP transporter large permease [Deltaproteobacteria bacterium]MBW2151612.1 TRAP transporter large permease [Deltaproteobacteria bacterium]